MQDHQHAQEDERLQSLHAFDVLDTPPEESFDRITRLMRLLLDVPIATVTLVDAHRLWFKSRQGIPVCEVARSTSICTTALRDDGPLIIPDTLEDARFRTNIHVQEGLKIRFYAGIPLRTQEGHVIGVLCAADSKPRHFDENRLRALSDLAQMVMDQMELRNLAAVDGLTGALTRRAFRSEADRAVSLAQRYDTELSCLTLDFDLFRSVNDTYGHSFGDRVLRETIGACRSILRKSDLIGRIGGEEFAVLLSRAGNAKALKVAHKLRTAIGGMEFFTEAGLPVRITASLGVASLDRSMAGIDDLVRRADEALMKAKADGRNRCSGAPSQDATPSLDMRRVLKAGRIVFNGGRSTVDCTVRGLSDQGASVDVVTSLGLPDDFQLLIGAERAVRACHIVGKKDTRVEVAFAR